MAGGFYANLDGRHCETRGKYASKESHAFEAYCDVHLALKASPCGLAISGNNRLSL